MWQPYAIGALANDQTKLIDETNHRFWERTHHKPGHRLDMSDPRDRSMARIWLQIYGEVSSHRDRARSLAHRALNETVTPYVLVIESHDGSMHHQEFPHRNNLDVQFMWLGGQPQYYKYLAAFDFTADRSAPISDQFAPTTASGGYAAPVS
jgi:hypothetical protein